MSQPPYPGYYSGAPVPPYQPNLYAAAPGVPAMFPGAPYAPNMYMHGFVPPHQQYHQAPAMPVPPPPVPYASSVGQPYPPRPPGPPALPSQDQGFVLSGAAKPSPLLARSAPSAVSASHLLKPMTAFISNIPLNVDDICMRQLLDQCGRVVKWNRMKNPKTEELRNFGFCQFLGPAGLVAIKKLLSGLKINEDDDDAGLLIHIDPKDEPLCQEYIAEIVENKDEEWNVKETIVNKIVQDRKLRLAEAPPLAKPAEKRPSSPQRGPSPSRRTKLQSHRDRSPARRDESPSRRDSAHYGHNTSPRRERSSERRYRRSRTPPPPPPSASAPITENEESEDGKPKKIEWKKTVAQKASAKTAAPIIDAFANHADENHIASLYSRKDRQLRPILKDPEVIWKQVPTDLNELTSYVFNWELLDRDAFYNVTIKQFVSQKVCEYLGQPEPELVSFIMSKIIANKPFKDIVEELKVVFGDHCQPFLLKIWSQMVFEYLSLQ